MYWEDISEYLHEEEHDLPDKPKELGHHLMIVHWMTCTDIL